MLEELIALAQKEVGYKANSGKSKYFESLFPGEREMPWCLPFIEWLFLQVYGRKRAMEMLHLTDEEWIYSVPAYVTYVKRANCWHRRTRKRGWLMLIATSNEWTNHVGLIVDIDYDKKEILVIEGNCGGKVEINSYSFHSSKITGFVQIDYEGSAGEN